MSDYARIVPEFWTGDTGRALRAGGPDALVIAVYLLSGPYRRPTGIYTIPVTTIAHHCSLDTEGASKGLAKVCRSGFASYSEKSDEVWVPSLARIQIATGLKREDKRWKWLISQIEKIRKSEFFPAFWDAYAVSFNLPKEMDPQAPCEGASQGASMGLGKPAVAVAVAVASSETTSPDAADAAPVDLTSNPVSLPPRRRHEEPTEWLTRADLARDSVADADPLHPWAGPRWARERPKLSKALRLISEQDGVSTERVEALMRRWGALPAERREWPEKLDGAAPGKYLRRDWRALELLGSNGGGRGSRDYDPDDIDPAERARRDAKEVLAQAAIDRQNQKDRAAAEAARARYEAAQAARGTQP